jgi:hypothetical protein
MGEEAQLRLWFQQAIKALAVHWHAAHGGGMFHACGVVRDNHGYLFLGQSGAGKTTVGALSGMARGIMIHEDEVVVGSDSGQYRLAHPRHSDLTPVLRAIFLLRQSKTDHLVTLSPRGVFAGLTRSILEYAVGLDNYGPWVRQAFHNAATMARCVPGFELHFRKSADFWDVIDAELRT